MAQTDEHAALSNSLKNPMSSMNLVIYSNCQGDNIYKHFLDGHLPIKTYTYIPCHVFINEKKPLPIDVLKQCDVFLYQLVQKIHGIYSTIDTSGVLQYLPSTCKKISFCYYYLDHYPLYEDPSGAYVGGDCIVRLKKQGVSLERILKMYEEGELDFGTKKRYEESIRRMREKESVCTIQAVDFILEHVKTTRLFDTINHPNGIVLAHVANKIFEVLGIDMKYEEFYYKHIRIHGFWAYNPYMKTEIGLEYSEPCQDYKHFLIGLYIGAFRAALPKVNMTRPLENNTPAYNTIPEAS